MSDQLGRGIRGIMSGAVLIGIGLTMGGSVFTGDAGLIDWLFDGLGVLMIGRGLLSLAMPAAEQL